MDAPERVAIIGGGLAGAKTAEALRDQGFDGTITLIAAESHLPYERPPLSKGYLQGEAAFTEAAVHDEPWYDTHDVDLRRSTRAVRIDRAAHAVILDDGSTVEYDQLVLATGSAPRRLPVSGADAEGIHYLRTVEDSDAIRETFGPGHRLLIVGAGWIGLEVAAAARSAGSAVTVIEAAELPLLRVLGPEMAKVFADLHRDHGVVLRLGAQLTEITVEGRRATGVNLDGGEHIDADAIVVGIGVVPDTSLAEQSGVEIDNGVLVDGALRTSDPDILAVGDIANHDHPVLGRRIRVEHWATALNQPTTAAATILGGDGAYRELPYFFTDQYDLGMEYLGHASQDTYARVVTRGDVAARQFVAFYLDEADRILAAMAVNTWDVIDQIKPLIERAEPVDVDRLTDPAVDYSELAEVHSDG